MTKIRQFNDGLIFYNGNSLKDIKRWYLYGTSQCFLKIKQETGWYLVVDSRVLHKYGSSLCPVLLEAASLSGQPIDSLCQLMTPGSDSQDWWAPVEADAWNELVWTVGRNTLLLVLAIRISTARPENDNITWLIMFQFEIASNKLFVLCLRFRLSLCLAMVVIMQLMRSH